VRLGAGRAPGKRRRAISNVCRVCEKPRRIARYCEGGATYIFKWKSGLVQFHVTSPPCMLLDPRYFTPDVISRFTTNYHSMVQPGEGGEGGGGILIG
jgi:hypothetical protein